MSAKTPWSAAAQHLRKSLDESLAFEAANRCRSDASTAILAMMGLGILPDCPSSFRGVAAGLDPDGVWGPQASAAYKLLEKLAPLSSS